MTENEPSVSTTSQVEDTADNSLSFDEQVANALDDKAEEPVDDTKADTESDEVKSDKVEEDADKPEANAEPEEELNVPEKFKNADGSVNIKNLLNSYIEAEKVFNEKAALEKERAQLLEKAKLADQLQQMQEQGAAAKGFNSYNDMQMAYSIAAVEANEYSKYLHLTDNPAEVMKLLESYRMNPTPELMRDIEIEFGSDVNKIVAAASERQKILYEQQLEQQKRENVDNSVRNTISQSVEKHEDIFNIEPFKKLFVSSLQRYGDNFTPEDSETLIQGVLELKEYFRNEYDKELKAKEENKKATDTISSIAPTTGSANVANATDIDKMTEDEFAKAVSRLL